MRTITCSEIKVGQKVKIPRGAHIKPSVTELDREFWIVNVNYVNASDDFVTVIGSAYQLELFHSHYCTLLEEVLND
jgi:hypothetical protein